MSKVISMRFQESQVERLDRVARRLGRTASETGALFVEEGVRRSEFAYIDFRDSSAGRQAYIQGTSLAVWEVVFVARSYDLNAGKTAENLGWPEARVQAALNYAAAFLEEIEMAISDNEALDFTALSHMLPQTEVFKASA